MTQSAPALLFVDDEELILSALRKQFDDRYTVITAVTGEEALAILQSRTVAVAVVDQRMPGIGGVETLKRIREMYPHTVRIALTAHADIQSLVESVNYGQIFRYVSKPWDTHDLEITIQEAVDKFLADQAQTERVTEIERLSVEKAKLEQEIVVLKSEIEKEFALDNIISASSEMNQVRRLIKAASLNDETILIQGESGTGKELVAKAIHYNSKRSRFKFIAVDCGALSETLLEGELFGHRKGAFTGAIQDQKGLFEEADGGTVFLDEISNTSIKLQARLLRVIQEKEIRRIGEMQPRLVDVRIITATNKDLREECRRGAFREDLFYRLNVIPIQLPSLRERRSDIPILINHFINLHNQQSEKKVRSISREALNDLCARTYPGNVRELKNLVNRMLVFAEHDHIDVDDIPEDPVGTTLDRKPSTSHNGSDGPFVISRIDPMDAVERLYIEYVLKRVHGNKSEAAKLLGMKRTTLHMRMKKLGLDS
jgi:DNA-binding NtrC family response regulator